MFMPRRDTMHPRNKFQAASSDRAFRRTLVAVAGIVLLTAVALFAQQVYPPAQQQPQPSAPGQATPPQQSQEPGSYPPAVPDKDTVQVPSNSQGTAPSSSDN